MRISVIIPAYRAARTIRRAIDTVLAQTIPATEIIVVDDGSPDEQAAVVADYGKRVSLIRKSNGGAASARNAGLERATGDVVAFLDADDYWEPHKLERQCDIFARHAGVGLVAGTYFLEPPGKPRYLAHSVGSEQLDRVLAAKGKEAFDLATKIWTGTVIVRRTALGSQRFVSGLETAEDRELWVRLVAANAAYLISEPLATAVLEEGSLSRTMPDRDYGNMLRVVHKYADVLGRSGVREWETNIYRGWAGRHLSDGAPSRAVVPASRRLWRQPHSPEAWWILAKTLILSCAGKNARPPMAALMPIEDSTEHV